MDVVDAYVGDGLSRDEESREGVIGRDDTGGDVAHQQAVPAHLVVLAGDHDALSLKSRVWCELGADVEDDDVFGLNASVEENGGRKFEARVRGTALPTNPDAVDAEVFDDVGTASSTSAITTAEHTARAARVVDLHVADGDVAHSASRGGDDGDGVVLRSVGLDVLDSETVYAVGAGTTLDLGLGETNVADGVVRSRGGIERLVAAQDGEAPANSALSSGRI